MQTFHTYSLKEMFFIAGFCLAGGIVAGMMIYGTIVAHYMGIL